MGSFTDSAESSVRVQKSSEKTVFPISQQNIHDSVLSQKANTRIEVPVKFNMTRPTHNISKVSHKVYLSNEIGFCAKVFLNQVLLPLVI